MARPAAAAAGGAQPPGPRASGPAIGGARAPPRPRPRGCGGRRLTPAGPGARPVPLLALCPRRLLLLLAFFPLAPPAPLAFTTEAPRLWVAALAAGSAGAAAACNRGACVREKPLRRAGRAEHGESQASCPTCPLPWDTGPSLTWQGFRQQEGKRGARGRDRAASRPSLRVLFGIPGLCKRCKIKPGRARSGVQVTRGFVHTLAFLLSIQCLKSQWPLPACIQCGCLLSQTHFKTQSATTYSEKEHLYLNSRGVGQRRKI
ncbi:uncharacterized protein LOC128785226 [Vidua chalybeata]|uniref:uncharacterized protein LOC128785226 n=1 Tax=Vidua chalybeata TaxID=81927 RepID=UPI0023A7E1C5|nr:uncharacterized protein LOC128785226 [Vidua chalybeata]